MHTDPKPDTPKIGCVALCRVSTGLFVAIDCHKGRGIVLPGGKWEPGESFVGCVEREFSEETGLVLRGAKIFFHGTNVDGWSCYVFKGDTQYYHSYSYKEKRWGYSYETREGKFRLATWDDLIDSKNQFSPLYELLYQKERWGI